MADLSRTPISVALDLFKGVKAILVALPLLTMPIENIEQSKPLSPMTTHIKQQGNSEFLEAFAKSLENDMKNSMLLLDAVIHLMPMIVSELSDREISDFGQELLILDKLVVSLSSNINDSFSKTVIQFSEKVHLMYQTMVSEKYKQTADKILVDRLYQDGKSVGYQFKPSDSFDDFKKAILG
ncbi:hypothetical protein A1D22_11335 [Pasteurellaceae bacterium LFhippo2]|nr:hypothetical protein [Pasteurellaceae bacterium LFhippo2]